MKKVLWIISAAAAVILATGLSGLLKAAFAPPETVIPATLEVAPAGILAPGTEAEFHAQVTLPADMKITGCQADIPGTAAAEANYRFRSWQWDRTKWLVSGKFRTLANGRIKGAKIEITTGKIWDQNSGKSYSADIPEIEVKLADNAVSDEELFLAPETENPELAAEKQPWYRKKTVWFCAAAVILAAITAGIIFLLSKRKKAMFIPLDRRVINEVAELKKLVVSGTISPARGFAQLCDILRGYLEERFKLPVTKCTTDEFIRQSDLSQLLPERREQLFLTGFLNSADMIKFAGAAADTLMFDRAAAQVEELVQVTTPQEVKK